MYVILGLFGPLLLLLIGTWRLRVSHSRGELRFLGLISLTMALATLFFWLMILHSSKLTDTREIAWTAVSTQSASGALHMGGRGVGADLDWPSGSSEPEVVFSAAEAGQVQTQVLGGGGFLRVPEACVGGTEEHPRVLGGVLVPEARDPDSALEIGQSKEHFRLVVRRGRGLFSSRRRLEIRADDADIQGAYRPAMPWYAVLSRLNNWWKDLEFGGPDASLLTSIHVDRDRLERRPSRLSSLLGGQLKELYSRGGKDAALAHDLERWGDVVIVAGSESGLVVQFPEAKTAVSDISIPCAGMETLHAGQAHTWFSLSRSKDGGVEVTFEPPWRRAALLPPGNGPFVNPDGDRVLTVASRARPGEADFLVPFHGTLTQDPPNVQIASSGGRFAASSKLRSSQANDEGPERREFSSAEVSLGNNVIGLGIADFLPSRSKILRTIVLSWVPVLLICFLLFEPGGSPAKPLGISLRAACLANIVIAGWLLLVLRFTLALRYAANPSTLDGLAIKGLVSAAGALVFGPLALGLMVLSRRYTEPVGQSMRFAALAGRRLLFFVGSLAFGLILALIARSLMTPSLWRRLPRGLPTFWSGDIGFWFFMGMTVALLGLFLTDFVSSSPRQRYKANLEWFERLVRVRSPRAWNSSIRLGGRIWSRVGWFTFVVLVVLVIVRVGLWWWGLGAAAVSELGLTFISLSVAAFWLGARDISPFSSSITPLRTALPWVSATFMLFLASPFFSGDPGAAYSSITLFVLVALVLATTLPFRMGGILLSALLVTIVAGGLIVFNWNTLGPYLERLPTGNLSDRVLVFRKGLSAQEDTIQRSPREARRLRNATYHVWANRALAHAGGWWGSGYGGSPVRQVWIRQDTLQADSVYSGFIVGDFGLMGGFFLLLLMAGPLAALLVFRPLRGSPGYLFAVLITGWLALEAIVHALMNLGLLPFSGRNLPLLSVQSPSDLVRWLVLLGLAGRALFWEERTGSYEAELPRRDHLPFVLVAVLGATLAVIGVKQVGIAKGGENDRKLSTFSLRSTLDPIEAQIRAGNIKLTLPEKAGSPKTVEDCAGGIVTLEGSEARRDTFLKDQVDRFNALWPEERVGAGSAIARTFRRELVRAQSPADFWKILAELSQQPTTASSSLVPLFRIALKHSGHGKESRAECVLQMNPDANQLQTLRGEARESDFPTVSVHDSAASNEKLAIAGPAWVMGKWRMATRPDLALGWLDRFTGVVADDLLPAMGKRGFVHSYGQLTLDQPWQAAAQEFALEKGHDLYLRTFRHSHVPPRVGSRRYFLLLPSRVALTVLDPSDGSVLALGSWPRTSGDPDWKSAGGNRHSYEIMPPAEWLGKPDMPRELRTRFSGDRNFDPLPMGSITKPLWAAAALAVHPHLDRRLAVRGSGGEEQEIFGVRLASPWGVGRSGSLSGGTWTDFKSFLARSDNRYAIRLGFLGLAETAGEDVKAEQLPEPKAVHESMDGGRTSWKRFPLFPESLGFNSGSPRVLHNLAETPLLQDMWQMFRLASTRREDSENDARYVVSFWTGNERDDTNQSSRGLHGAWRLPVLSPAQANLELNRFGKNGAPGPPTARDYIAILLGGRTNRWANVEFAAAFSSAVTGHPVAAHIAAKPGAPQAERPEFTTISQRIRPGLSAVFAPGGTAHRKFAGSQAWRLISGLRGVHAYAKTGTLDEPDAKISRFCTSLVRWRNENKGDIDRGLTICVAAENAPEGTATAWARDFIEDNADLFLAYFARHSTN